MSILHVVDNKYRDLWGFYEVRKKLNQKNINLFFCNKFNWNLAIKYINPTNNNEIIINFVLIIKEVEMIIPINAFLEFVIRIK